MRAEMNALMTDMEGARSMEELDNLAGRAIQLITDFRPPERFRFQYEHIVGAILREAHASKREPTSIVCEIYAEIKAHRGEYNEGLTA